MAQMGISCLLGYDLFLRVSIFSIFKIFNNKKKLRWTSKSKREQSEKLCLKIIFPYVSDISRHKYEIEILKMLL